MMKPKVVFMAQLALLKRSFLSSSFVITSPEPQFESPYEESLSELYSRESIMNSNPDHHSSQSTLVPAQTDRNHISDECEDKKIEPSNTSCSQKLTPKLSGTG